MPYDVLLVDDHKIMRDGIKAILERSGEFRVVGEAEDGSTHFSVNIIPHTAHETTLGGIIAGRQFNVEVDVLARYIDRMLAARSQ